RLLYSWVLPFIHDTFEALEKIYLLSSFNYLKHSIITTKSVDIGNVLTLIYVH
uniref:Uncharacterized protein n=1 Tax=Oryza brachyantha TaxID=4533 RepID=J3L1N5_ORYBR